MPNENNVMGEVPSQEQENRNRQRDLLQQEVRANKEYRETRNTALLQMRSAINRKTVLREQVIGVSEDEKSAYLIVNDPNLKIIVRFEESSSLLPEELIGNSNPATIRRQSQMLNKMVGSSIDFLPYATTVDENGNEIVVASRRQAMRTQRHRYFLDTQRVRENDIVDADVLSVGNHSLLICVCGVDMILPVRNISYRPMKDLTEYFYPGDTLRVKITELNLTYKGTGGSAQAQNQKPNTVEIKVSGKEAELAELYPRRRSRIERGVRYSATVLSTSMRKDKEGHNLTLINLYIDVVGYPARASVLRPGAAGSKPIGAGDRVLFEVRGFDSYGLATGDVVRYIRQR